MHAYNRQAPLIPTGAGRRAGKAGAQDAAEGELLEGPTVRRRAWRQST